MSIRAVEGHIGVGRPWCSGLTRHVENFSAFEVDEELLPNLREYSLANSIYWGLAEGHACEQSARRNAMDVSRNWDWPLDVDRM